VHLQENFSDFEQIQMNFALKPDRLLILKQNLMAMNAVLKN
jgi:hypothetical protein